MRSVAAVLCVLLIGSACGGSSSSEIEALEERIAGLQEQIAVLEEPLDETPTLSDGSATSDVDGSYTHSNKFRELIPTRGDPNVLTALTTTTAPTTTVPTTTTAPTTTVPTTTTVRDTSSPKESSGNEPGSCVEMFVFEESAEPSDQSSVFRNTLAPSNANDGISLRILPCEAVEYMTTFIDGPSLVFELEESASSDSSYDIFWLDRSGNEKAYGAFGNNTKKRQQTYVGHVWVVRHATPQPELTVVSNCDDMETRQSFTFQLQSIHGWGIYFECVIEYLPGLMSTIVPELTADLQHITTLLPEPILSRLQSTRFFVVASSDAKPTAQMRERGGAVFMNPRGDMARQKVPELYSASVVISAQSWSNTRRWQPAGLTLHELAHAWHCMNWNPCFDGAAEIRAAYDAAMTSGIYDLVDRNSGNQEKAYAATNDHEYFAELTEAWFWENDYYPYNREQLLTHDPVGAAAVEAAWTVND